MPDTHPPQDKKNFHWSKRAIVYQIYPMSFKDSDGDGKGDLAGIIEKIDYLHSIGINAVWICPFYKSPMVDLGYDIVDFKSIDPLFGDMQTFETMVAEFHKRDIKIIIDFVGNHTSDQHPWFVESRKSKDNPKRDWYVWRDGDIQGGPPNNWISVFHGSAWELDPRTNQYYLHSFLKEQPDINWRNPEVQEAMFDVIDFWIKKGVDGFRIDAFLHFLEDKFLREDPINPLYKKDIDQNYNALIHSHSLGEMGRDVLMKNFVQKVLNTYTDAIIVCEAYIGPADIRKLHNLYNSERFIVFNFNFINKRISATLYKQIIDEYLIDAPKNFLPNFVLGNHDVDRVATRLSSTEARVAALLQLTLPGMPFIYYGEEIGMTNTTVPTEAIRDTVARFLGNFQNGRDPERTPMQWNDTHFAGFSTHRPWLPVNSNYKSINVETERSDPNSMLSLYRELIRLRHESEVFATGEYIPKESSSANVISFERRSGESRYFITANLSNNVEREILPTNHTEADIIFSTVPNSHHAPSTASIELLPFEGCIIRLK